MTEVTQLQPHPSDGDLVRYLDNQLSDLQHRRIRTHLAACQACERQLARLREQSATATAILRELDQGIRIDPLVRARALAAAEAAAGARRTVRTGMSPAWRAAAAVALVLAGALGVAPLRAWVSDLWKAGGEGRPSASVPTLPTAVVERTGPMVMFEPALDSFEIRVLHAQPEGAVVVEVRDVPRVAAQIRGGGAESILVLPGGIQVENQTGSGATYHITVPASLRQVRVTVGERTIATIIPVRETLPLRRTIPLVAQP